MKSKFIILLFIIAFIFISCETEIERKERLALEEHQKIELDQQKEKEVKAEAVRLEQVRIEQEIQLEKQREEKELYDRFINNSLTTGATPYSKYYGRNASCNDNNCSQIKITTSNSDVLVTIKKKDKVIRHAFIKAGDSYTFSFPNGTYQAFFYYGKGWNPDKPMKKGEITGGFISNEDFGKDEPQFLFNNILRYELILQKNGNFSTEPSNSEEAL